MAVRFLPRRQYVVTVTLDGDYYDDCYCSSMNAVINYITRIKDKILGECRELIVLPPIDIHIADFKSSLDK